VDERKQLVAAGYDEVACEYARLERPGREWPRLRLLRDLLARLDPGSSILDLGCGNGVPAPREIVRLHKGVGVDISKVQIELAQANVPSAELLHADAMELEFPPRSFDAVVGSYSTTSRERNTRVCSPSFTSGCDQAGFCSSVSSLTRNLPASVSGSDSPCSSVASMRKRPFASCELKGSRFSIPTQTYRSRE
jgi:SAM-dependent methyltransferase